jgi:hypothetical protein
LEKNFTYYLNNKKNLEEKFGCSFVVIQNQKIIDSLPSFKDALRFLDSKKGDFLVQEINTKDDSQTAIFSL